MPVDLDVDVEVDDYSMYCQITIQGTSTRHMLSLPSTHREFANAVVSEYKWFWENHRIRGRVYTALIACSGMVMPFFPSTARTIISRQTGRIVSLGSFARGLESFFNENQPSEVVLRIYTEETTADELAAEAASLQSLHDERYRIQNVNHPIPGIGGAAASNNLTGYNTYTLNRVDPNAAVYLQPNLNREGRVTALYDWNSIRQTLGQNPIQSPASRAPFTVNDVHRMNSNAVRAVIERNRQRRRNRGSNSDN